MCVNIMTDSCNTHAKFKHDMNFHNQLINIYINVHHFPYLGAIVVPWFVNVRRRCAVSKLFVVLVTLLISQYYIIIKLSFLSIQRLQTTSS